MFLTTCEGSGAAASRWDRPIGLNWVKTRRHIPMNDEGRSQLALKITLRYMITWHAFVGILGAKMCHNAVLAQATLGLMQANASRRVVVYSVARSPLRLALMVSTDPSLSVSSCAFSSAVWGALLRPGQVTPAELQSNTVDFIGKSGSTDGHGFVLVIYEWVNDTLDSKVRRRESRRSLDKHGAFFTLPLDPTARLHVRECYGLLPFLEQPTI